MSATYRTDTAWQAARARYIDPRTGDPTRDLIARNHAARELYRIECRHAGIEPDQDPNFTPTAGGGRVGA